MKLVQVLVARVTSQVPIIIMSFWNKSLLTYGKRLAYFHIGHVANLTTLSTIGQML